MKILLIVIIIFLTIRKDISAQNGWYSQQSNINLNLQSVWFINSQTGWTAGDSGVILKTNDGGANWVRQISNTDRKLSHIAFYDSLHGIAGGSSYEFNPFCYERLVILSTSTGGNTWNVIVNTFGDSFHDMCLIQKSFYNAFEGTDLQCFSSTGYITKSDNNGVNWNYFNFGAYGYRSISFIDSATGWASGELTTDYGFSVQHLIKTTDAGQTWNVLISDTNIYQREYKVKFYDQNTGYKITNKLLKSTDGGYNWNNTDSITTYGMNSHFFIHPDTGWCIGSNSRIIRTNNGAAEWVQQSSGTSENLYSIFFLNKDTGYIVGSGGKILKTITGGLTSINQVSSQPDNFSLSQNYPNPFNPLTIIIYELGIFTNNVKLKVYDILGNEIAVLVNERQNAGSYEFEFDGSGFASGIYFYKLEAGDFVQTRKMLLIK